MMILGNAGHEGNYNPWGEGDEKVVANWLKGYVCEDHVPIMESDSN